MKLKMKYSCYTIQFFIWEGQATTTVQTSTKDDDDNRSDSVSGRIVVNGQYIALGRELPGATQRPQVFTAAAPVKH